MQRDEQVSLNESLDKAISLTDFDVTGRQKIVEDLLKKGAQVTPAFLEKAIATDDYCIIHSAIEAAIRSGVKPTAACLHIAIDRRAKVTESAGYKEVRLILNVYYLVITMVKQLIKAGAEVTPEILDKAVADEKAMVNSNGENIIIKFWKKRGGGETTIPKIIKAELKKIAEVRINAQVLAQAYRTGTGPGTVFFGGAQIPPEILAKIALLMGDNPDVIEDDQKAYKIARDIFRP